MEGRRLLAGRYELRERLGERTWLANDLELGREVAVRFGEVGGVALSHPSIARVFDQGEADGERYAVLEHLPGGTLAERGALSEEGAAGLAAALAYAHEQGVAHGALGADAVLFDAEGRPKLTGFRGEGDPEADLAALAALRSEYAATEVRAPAAEEATAVQPAPTAQPRRRWGLVAAILAALALAAAGLAAALLAGDDDGGSGEAPATDPITSATIPTDTGTGIGEPTPPPPSTTVEETTTTATTATTEPEPPTTTAEPEPPTTATVAPPVPTEPPLPSIPTEPPATLELPPPPTETVP